MPVQFLDTFRSSKNFESANMEINKCARPIYSLESDLCVIVEEDEEAAEEGDGEQEKEDNKEKEENITNEPIAGPSELQQKIPSQPSSRSSSPTSSLDESIIVLDMDNLPPINYRHHEASDDDSTTYYEGSDSGE